MFQVFAYSLHYVKEKTLGFYEQNGNIISLKHTFNNYPYNVTYNILLIYMEKKKKTVISIYALSFALLYFWFDCFFQYRYRRVAYMDTDVGQAEFTPPGCLSLTVIDEETLGIGCFLHFVV